MKLIDPHVDIADIYKNRNYSPADFYSDKKDLWVSLPKIKQSNIDVLGFSLYFDKSFLKTSFYDGVHDFWNWYEQLVSNSQELVVIKTAQDFLQKPNDKIGYFYTLEGLECLRTPTDFHEFYDMGVRCFGFTWSYENDYASGRHSKVDGGLTDKGKEVLEQMKKKNKLVIDIAHLSENSVRDIAKNWEGMILTTHGNAKSVFNATQNLTDTEIEIIVERDGVVSLFPLAEETGKEGTFDELYRHLDYIASKWGIEHVAFSSDIYPLPEYPYVNNAQDITIAKDWTNYLLTKLDEKTVEQILWGNWARVIEKCL